MAENNRSEPIKRKLNLCELPSEILSHVFRSQEPSRELAAAALTCRRFYEIAGPLLYERPMTEGDYYGLFWAAEHNRVDILRRFTQVRRPNPGVNVYVFHGKHKTYLPGPLSIELRRRPGRYWTPLHQAAMVGAAEAVEFLLDMGADIDAHSLGTALLEHWPNEMRSDIEFGDRANFNVPTLAHSSVLTLSILYNKPAVTEMLVRRGADVHFTRVRTGQKFELTALHCAASMGQTEAIKILVKQGGLSPDQLDHHGCPPLMWAALGEDGQPAIQALLDVGANINLRIRSDIPPQHDYLPLVEILVERERPDAAQRLLDAGAGVPPEEES